MCSIPSVLNTKLSPIQWYFTKCCQDIEQGKSDITHICESTDDSAKDVDVDKLYECRNTSVHQHIQNSTLTISKVDTESTSAGYYWCNVQEKPFPSQMIYIPDSSTNDTIMNFTILSHVSCMSAPECTDDRNQTVSLVELRYPTCHGDSETGAPTVITTEQQTTTDERNESFPIEIVWVSIGVVLALLLLGVVILLTIIAALRCKKREVKGEPGY